jgi:hypothetical protein
MPAKEKPRKDKGGQKLKSEKVDSYKPGMKWDNDWEGEVKNTSRKARREFQQKYPEEGKADYIKIVEEMRDWDKAR